MRSVGDTPNNANYILLRYTLGTFYVDRVWLVARVVCTKASEMVEKWPFRAIDLRHMRTGHSHITKLNSNTQGAMVSVAIEFGEQVMARCKEQLTCVRVRRPFAAPPTAPVGAP